MKKYTNIIKFIVFILSFSYLISCDEQILNERPLSFISPDNAYTTKDAFLNGIYAMHAFARREQEDYTKNGVSMYYEMSLGTDVAHIGERYNAGSERFWDYSIITSDYTGSSAYWNWAYGEMISNANTIIDRAEISDIVWTEAEKNAIIAEAKFFRAYTYNALVNLFGDVPLVKNEIRAPKLDFVRAPRVEVLDFVQQDLNYAAQWLPENEAQDGRITKAAANHLLTEVNISLGLAKKDPSYYDKAIAAATTVISDPKYKLMTHRFGVNKDQPGDVFHDLFWDYNVNRSSGNTETIWALQWEYLTTGGGGGWSNYARAWGPRYWDVKDPAGKSGMMVDDSLGRPVGWIRPTNLVFYDVWKDDWNDMRNSKYNIKRDWWYNNPASAYYGQKVVPTASFDTLWIYYPYIGKLQGDFAKPGASTGWTPKDQYRMRLAETYLLRAEAYMWKGDKVKAAEDINVVRARANAAPVAPADVDIDYILDERVRELIVEEPRRRTLVRLGKLYERTKKYNYLSGRTIQPYNELLPIPRTAIDANSGAVLEQNPGYK